MSMLRSALLASVLAGSAWADDRRVFSRAPAVPLTSLEARDDDVLSRMLQETRTLLQAAGVTGTVTGRVKSPESRALKQALKGISDAAIRDRIGLRILVDTVEDCYRVQELLHDHFELVADSSDDYIRSPKANGYRSLHSNLLHGADAAEFQVRTWAMHFDAEHGQASHRAYKRAQRSRVVSAAS